MNKAIMVKKVNNLGKWINHNSPKILTILGIGSGITAAYMACKVTSRYEDAIDTLHMQNINAKPEEKLEKKQMYWEEAKIFAKHYGPSIGVGIISAASIISAQHINNKRVAGLATAYKLSESALREYQSKVIEKVGEKKAEQIKKEIIEDRLAKEHPREEDLTDLPRQTGDYLCYDKFLDKYFYSTQTKIEKAFLIINNRLRREDWVNLNDLYFELGYAKGSSVGRMLGWNMGYLPETGVEPEIRAIVTDDGPVLTLDYDADLRTDYS